MTYLNQTIEEWLSGKVNIVRFVDISALDFRQNRGMPCAVLLGIAMSPKFIDSVDACMDEDEYVRIEHEAGMMADELALWLVGKGYKAISQSDRGMLEEKAFDAATKTSVLPHKTIAMLSGSGWIGKNNLFVFSEYGAAQCLGSVLTNAPLAVIKHEIVTSKCGKCVVCVQLCPKKALKGRAWSQRVSRDDMIDVYECVTCLKCLIHCPVTQMYFMNLRKVCVRL